MKQIRNPLSPILPSAERSQSWWVCFVDSNSFQCLFFLKTARTPLLMSNKRISTPAWKNLFIKGSMHRGEESALHGRNNRVMSCWWMFRTIIVLISDVTVTWTVIPLITTWKLQVTLRNRLSWIGTLRNCSTRNIELHNWNKFRGMLLS